MATITRDAVMAALATVDDPDLKRDLVSLNMVRDVTVEGDAVSLRVVLTTPACPLKDKIRGDVVAALAAIGVTAPRIEMDAEVRHSTGRKPQAAGRSIEHIRAIVAVASGKGGVGKSTVAVNLAVGLARAGAKVGLLDADIYGPSMPVMLGLRDARPTVTEDEKIAPILRYGIKVMSMGFMLADDDAVVWRGPMLGKALEQFLFDVDWGELDYLIIDMPPGTGDVQLTLAQAVPVTGAVVVTTPQDVAFADVRRAIKMFEMTKTPVLGIVENMSYFVCGNCQAQHHLFGESRTAAHAAGLGMTLLGQIPLDSVTAIAADQGQPIVVAAPDSPSAKGFLGLAGAVSQQVSILTHADGEGVGAKFQSFFKLKSE